MQVIARHRILVIEDEEAIARLLTRYLTAAGFEVHSESRGAEAVKCAKDQKPDLVILDLRLPDLDGHDVCKALRELYPPWDLPILMLTTLDSPGDRLRGLDCGADAYLTKPFEPPALLPTIALLLGKTTEN